jgi:serine/threonine protein kinase
VACHWAVLAQQNRPFTAAEFLPIAIACADALAQVHAAQVIHKDINSENILINPTTKQVKIIDFGISTLLECQNPIIGSANTLEGTLAYISPEQTGQNESRPGLSHRFLFAGDYFL